MRHFFALEAVQAHEGDALLLRYGTAADSRLVMIDGGPADTYEPWIRPRLEALARGRAPLTVELLMVSHIDDDHINGVLDLFEQLADADGPGGPAPVTVREVWHNSFRDLTRSEPPRELAERERAVSRTSRPSIVRSVPQGRALRALVERLGLPLNAQGADGVITDAVAPVVLAGDLTLTVIAPNQQRVQALQEKWQATRGVAPALERAVDPDDSVFNLASLVVLAEYHGRTMLLTGDALDKDILDGLEHAGYLDADGRAHVDVLKLPHHGSDRNVSTEFFRRVMADHYVVSGDGKHDNPELATIQMLADARANQRYTLHLTNRETRLAPVLRARPKRTVKVRERDALYVGPRLTITV